MPFNKKTGVFTAKSKTYQGKIVPLVKRTVQNYVKQKVASMVETKAFPSAQAFSDLEAASQIIVNLTGIAQGDQYNQRTGEVIMPSSIRGRIAFRSTATVMGAGAQVRVMIVKAKQCDGTLPTLADILPTASGTLDLLCVDSPFTDAGLVTAKRKFSVIYDRWLTCPYDTTVSLNNIKMLKVNLKLSGKTFFSANNATDEGNNQYILMVHTNAADDKIECAYDLRTFFKDA